MGNESETGTETESETETETETDAECVRFRDRLAPEAQRGARRVAKSCDRRSIMGDVATSFIDIGNALRDQEARIQDADARISAVTAELARVIDAIVSADGAQGLFGAGAPGLFGEFEK